jgi:hypothetical protein
MSLDLIESRGRCPITKSTRRCVHIAGHSAPCRFHDADAEALWRAIADLMGRMPIRYHTGDPASVREIPAPAAEATPLPSAAGAGDPGRGRELRRSEA